MAEKDNPQIGASINQCPTDSLEWDLAFSGSATLANRFFISSTPYGLRVAFLEQSLPEKPSAFRTGVILSWTDAVSLSVLLQKVLRDHGVEEALPTEQEAGTNNGHPEQQ